MPTCSQSRALPRLSGERGWTLVELLIGSVMTLAVVFAALPILDGAATTENRIQTSGTSIDDARNFSDRILADLRPAYDLSSYSPTGLTVSTYVRRTACGNNTVPAPDQAPIPCKVTYACSGGDCTRQEAPVSGAGGGPPVTMVRGLSEDDVFSYPITTSDVPDFVGIKLVLPNQQGVGGNAIKLQDGTALRNLGNA